MAAQELTIEDLKSILLTTAGADEAVDLDGDILDLTFEELGYDSVALLETCGWIEREHEIELEDSTIEDAHTPRALLAVVNARLVQEAAA
jgi:act minimal PKS acyl carrier protein